MRALNYFISILLLFAFLSCQNINDSTSNQSSQKVPFSLKIAMNNAPSNVATVVGQLERSGYNTILQQFIIEDDTASADFGQVVAGLWHLSVTAFDSSATSIYFGETDINIIAGLTNIVYLQLDPLTGSLVVVVTWGNTNEGEYILFYNHTIAPRNVYRFNLQTSLMEQLTNVDRAVHPEYLSNIEKITFLMKDQNEMWIMNPDGSNKQLFFNLPYYHPYGPKFCNATDKLYYYTIESYRRLAYMDYNGQNVQYLTFNDSYNNAGPDINTDGDSLLFQSDRYGVYNIFLLNISTTSQSQITFSNTKCSLPQWSKNKNGLYYKKEISSGNHDLMFYNFSNQLSELILHFENLYFWYYGFSPNEDKIAFVLSNSSNPNDPKNLYIYDIMTSSFTQKTFDSVLYDKPKWLIFPN